MRGYTRQTQEINVISQCSMCITLVIILHFIYMASWTCEKIWWTSRLDLFYRQIIKMEKLNKSILIHLPALSSANQLVHSDWQV